MAAPPSPPPHLPPSVYSLDDGASAGAGAGASAVAGVVDAVAASAAGAASGAGAGAETGARRGAISWDHYFMSVAYLAAQRSKDPSTQVGACVVDALRRVVSVGYNGFPSGCSDAELPWAREAASPLDTKYPYVVHAEANALLNASGGAPALRGCALYVALFPCCECAKLIIQAGIREVVYHCDKYHDTVPMVAARRMFALAGVATRQFSPPAAQLVINFAQ